MARPHSGRQVTFPPGYAVPRWLVPAFRLANRSRTLRRLALEVPAGRLRMFLLANYYRWMMDRFLVGEADQVLGAFAPDGVWHLFGGLETYRGAEGFAQMWTNLLDTFPMTGELAEFIEPVRRGGRFVGVVRSTTRGRESGLVLEELSGELSVVVAVARGDAIRGDIYRSKSDALAAL